MDFRKECMDHSSDYILNENFILFQEFDDRVDFLFSATHYTYIQVVDYE